PTPRQGERSWLPWPRQSPFYRSRALDRAHRLALAQPSAALRQLVHELHPLLPLEEKAGLATGAERPRDGGNLRIFLRGGRNPRRSVAQRKAPERGTCMDSLGVNPLRQVRC